MSISDEGPTGAILRDLPSPYLPHRATGLLHLPRFLAKIRKHLAGELPKSYQRNFTKGFDGFLCLHLGIDPQSVIELVQNSPDEDALEAGLKELLPPDPRPHVWNRKVVQMGMSPAGREKLAEVREQMGVPERTDIISFADMIDFDEGRLP
jgi:hypothetical protein